MENTTPENRNKNQHIYKSVILPVMTYIQKRDLKIVKQEGTQKNGNLKKNNRQKTKRQNKK